jgi:hypothetical protein
MAIEKVKSLKPLTHRGASRHSKTAVPFSGAVHKFTKKLGQISMRRYKKFGVASTLLGVMALVLAISVFHIERFQTFDPRGQAVVLGLIDRLGLVKAPDMHAESSISAVGLTSINDTNAIEFLRIYAWWFSLCAIGIAFFAERQREVTLFLSIGSVCGCFAVLFVGGAAAGMIATVGCSLIHFLIRIRSASKRFLT